MTEEFFSDFFWHSAIGMDDTISGDKRFFTKLPNNKKARQMFVVAGEGKLLIHKTSQALWKVSEDGKSIVPVFNSDVLTEEELKGEEGSK